MAVHNPWLAGPARWCYDLEPGEADRWQVQGQQAVAEVHKLAVE